MSGHRTLQSPVLVGRDDVLALAERRLAAAMEGRGHLLFLAGEAGIGKTRLLDSIARGASRRSFELVRAVAFPGDTDASGGLLLELASDLRQSRDSRLQDVGGALSARLRDLATVDGDRHRQRRLLVQDLTENEKSDDQKLMNYCLDNGVHCIMTSKLIPIDIDECFLFFI